MTLSIDCVDDVVIGAPYIITSDLLYADDTMLISSDAAVMQRHLDAKGKSI